MQGVSAFELDCCGIGLWQRASDRASTIVVARDSMHRLRADVPGSTEVSGANAGKGEQSTMREHCISFEQPEGPDVTYAAFEWNMSLHDKISISFVGSQGQFEHRLKAAMLFGTMLMALNVTLMMQYIRFFRAIERAGYDKAVLPGDGGGRTVDWELMKRYFGGGAKDDGSLLKRLLDSAKLENDPVVVAVDVVSSSADPAAAQQQATEVHGDGEAYIAVDATTVLEHIFVATNGGDDAANETSNDTSLRAMRALFPQTIKLSRSENHLSDYENGELTTQLVGANPTLFLLGNRPKNSGSLSVTQSRHLLLQYQTFFGSNPVLIFTFLNQYRRACVNRSVAGAVRNNTEAFRVFEELTSDPTFLDKLAFQADSIAAAARRKEQSNCPAPKDQEQKERTRRKSSTIADHRKTPASATTWPSRRKNSAHVRRIPRQRTYPAPRQLRARKYLTECIAYTSLPPLHMIHIPTRLLTHLALLLIYISTPTPRISLRPSNVQFVFQTNKHNFLPFIIQRHSTKAKLVPRRKSNL